MSFATHILPHATPASIRKNVSLPRRQRYHPSPADWRDEVLYFLLVDRFSDGGEANRPLLDRTQLAAARPASPNGEPWRWDRWAASGAERWQGGTIRGVRSKLGYLKKLGVTALWLSPVFKQRGHLDSYHGYGIQDFLDVDPRYGDRGDLVDLVSAAHDQGFRIILDIIFNHSGANWVYPNEASQPPYTPFPGQYAFGRWYGADGQAVDHIGGREDGVWPTEFQDADHYTRAGLGDLGAGDVNDPHAEHKRTDFFTLRDFQLDAATVLSDLAQCFKYWIALCDCDGFRIDTLKHVSTEQARNFCGAIKEYAANIGKSNFFLVGEIAGGDFAQDRYLDALTKNLDAALDIGQMRPALGGVAKGLAHPQSYFGGFDDVDEGMGSHRNVGKHHVSILDDHDHVFGEKLRFSAAAASDHQVVAGVALQLFTLGIPCVYYGTEQALAGPEPSERHWLPEWGRSDRYLREAMFGPEHPRPGGRAGLNVALGAGDVSLPGFGPFGTAGHHCFDEASGAFQRIAALSAVRRTYPVLRVGRQYLRAVSMLGQPFAVYGNGEIMAWSRILDDEEALCVLNPHGNEMRGADVIVDAALNRPGSVMTVVLNTAEAAAPAGFAGSHKIGSQPPIHETPDGKRVVSIRDLPPSEVLVLTNHPKADEGRVIP